jgi:hypothetical protein
MQTKAARQIQDKNYTVENLLQSRSNGNAVHSLASVYGRHHDGDSIATEPQTDATTDAKDNRVIVQINPDTTIERPSNEDERSFDASTAGYTTGTTHDKLHEQQCLVARLLEQNRELEARYNPDADDQTIQTTQTTGDKLANAMARLEMIAIKPPENMADPRGMIPTTTTSPSKPRN